MVNDSNLSQNKVIASLQEDIFQLRNIIKKLPGNIYWLNKDGICLGCNDNLAKISGFNSSEELIGKSLYDFLPKEKAEEAITTNNKVMTTGKEISIEEDGFNTKGLPAIYLTRKMPLQGTNTEITGVIGTSIDITSRKKAEKLQTEKNAAVKALEMIELLSASIAFEMRSAMAVIGINADLLRLAIETVDRDLNSTEEHRNIKTMHDHIKYAIHNSETIVNMLLTKVNNVIAGKIDSKDFEFQSIKNVITSSIDEYPFLEKEKKLVHWDPKANEKFKYFGREGLTKNVLFNLIKNALCAIKEYDKGEIFITLASDEKFNYLIFKDTGMGIPESHLANLFQQFNTHTSGGSGLGLAFCKMVMTSYGGDITCKSKEREFTEFTLSFPKDGGTNTTLKQKITARQAK